MADILIPNIEIPKEGYAVQIILFDDCRVQFSGRTVKAVKLPPHGDLISRDEAVSVLQSIGSRDYRREKGTICDAIKMIAHSQYVPTIVPASEEVE